MEKLDIKSQAESLDECTVSKKCWTENKSEVVDVLSDIIYERSPNVESVIWQHFYEI